MDFENSAHILDEEDEGTLAILKKRIKSSDEGDGSCRRSPSANEKVAYKILYNEDAPADLEAILDY